MINVDSVYESSSDFVFRNIGGELVLVPVKNVTADLNSLFTMNEVAGRFYELLDGRRTVQEIVAILFGEYDVEEQVLAKDVQELIEQLVELEVIVKK